MNKNQISQARRLQQQQHHVLPASPPLPATSNKPNRAFFKKRRQRSHSTDQSDSDGNIELSPMVNQCSAASRFSLLDDSSCRLTSAASFTSIQRHKQTFPRIYDDDLDDRDFRRHNDSASIYSDHSDRRRRSYSAVAAVPTRKRRLNEHDEHWT